MLFLTFPSKISVKQAEKSTKGMPMGMPMGMMPPPGMMPGMMPPGMMPPPFAGMPPMPPGENSSVISIFLIIDVAIMTLQRNFSVVSFS